MFQTEPVLFLQQFAETPFHWLMVGVNQLGATLVAILVAVFLLGVKPRHGFILLNVVVITAIAIELLKEYFGLPRPIYVDNNILFLDNVKPNETPFDGMGAASFFGALPQEVVDYNRASANPHWGFPSGHVGGTVAIWFGLALLQKSRSLLVGAATFVLLVAIARIYFGKHFIADVLGGIAVAGCVLTVAWFAAWRYGGKLAEERDTTRPATSETIWHAGLIALPLSILLLGDTQLQSAACLLGVNAGFLWLRRGAARMPQADLPAQLASGAASVLLLLLLAALALAAGRGLGIGQSPLQLTILVVLMFGFAAGSLTLSRLIRSRWPAR